MQERRKGNVVQVMVHHVISDICSQHPSRPVSTTSFAAKYMSRLTEEVSSRDDPVGHCFGEESVCELGEGEGEDEEEEGGHD